LKKQVSKSTSAPAGSILKCSTWGSIIFAGTNESILTDIAQVLSMCVYGAGLLVLIYL
jgi:hypothetical protein